MITQFSKVSDYDYDYMTKFMCLYKLFYSVASCPLPYL